MMTQEEIIDEYNYCCAEFLGAKIFEKEESWKVINWDNPDKIVSSIPFTFWGSKETTYKRILDEQLSTSYGRWGQFHSSWNLIHKVVEAINKTQNPRQGGDLTHSTLKREIQTHLGRSNKEATVKSIHEFLKWYKNQC